MSYSTVTAVTGAVIPAADINKLMENIDLVKGGTAGIAPSTTIEALSTAKMAKITPADGVILQSDENGQAESSGISSANVVTSSANFAIDEILLGAGADKTAKKSGKTIEDTPTDTEAKVTTSKHFYDIENSLVESVGSNGVNKSGGAVAGTIFDAVGAPSLSLGVGTWLITGHTGVYTSASNGCGLRLVNTTDSNTVFGYGTSGVSPVQYTPQSCSGVLQVTSGTKVVKLYAIQFGTGANLFIGTSTSYTNLPSGYLVARRIR